MRKTSSSLISNLNIFQFHQLYKHSFHETRWSSESEILFLKFSSFIDVTHDKDSNLLCFFWQITRNQGLGNKSKLGKKNNYRLNSLNFLVLEKARGEWNVHLFGAYCTARVKASLEHLQSQLLKHCIAPAIVNQWNGQIGED